MVKYYNDKSILPNTDKVARTTLCLPLHQSLTTDDVNNIVDKIRNCSI